MKYMETEQKIETQLKIEKKPAEVQNKLSIPMAIVVAGALIAGAVYFSSIKSNPEPQQKIIEGGQAESLLENVRAVSRIDHIRGNMNAPVKVIEYSDTECPFCKNFHNTMKQILNDYGDKVAWVYRHSPIDSLHPKARKEAQALECANELGGNDKFWEYADRLYEITPANNGLDLSELPKIAQYVGLDVSKFNACLESEKYIEVIENDSKNAAATGGGGTPWSIVIAKNGKKYPINGAVPYQMLKQTIEAALK